MFYRSNTYFTIEEAEYKWNCCTLKYYKNKCEGWIENLSRGSPFAIMSDGMLSDDKQWLQGTDFPIPSSHKLLNLFLAHQYIAHFILEKHENDFQKILHKLRCGIFVIRWRHLNITLASQIDVWPVCVSRMAIHFLSFLLVGTSMWERIVSYLQKQRKSLSGVPGKNETRW